MADGLKMSYSDMESCCGQLETIATDIESNKGNMSSRVSALCDSWEAEASPVYQGDYETIAKSIDNTIDVVRQLTASVRKYIADMQDLDSSYSSTKVN